MPKGQPSPDHIIGRKVSFFSIDTNIFEGFGFDFNMGALNVLRGQRPNWMTLHLSAIVEREVFAHRLRALKDADKKLHEALNYIRRKTSLDVSQIESTANALSIVDTAKDQFETEIRSFVSELGGSILATSGNTLAHDLFELYFSQQSPFELIKDKKSEFPDGAALLVLEQFAKDHKTKGILISKDKGWQSFANKSDHLFCLNSLDDFTGLFKAVSGHAADLLAKIKASLENTSSSSHALIHDAITTHVAEATWSVGDLYSGTVSRLEGDVYDSNIVEFIPNFQNIQGWFTDEDSPLYVVELPVLVNVEVVLSVEFFHWDSIDREEISIGSKEITVPMNIDISVFLTSTGDLMAEPVDEWGIEVEIANGNYSVEVGEVNPNFGDDEDY